MKLSTVRKTAPAAMPAPRMNDDGSITLSLPVPARACSPNCKRGESKWAAIVKSKIIKSHRMLAKHHMQMAMMECFGAARSLIESAPTYSLAHYFKTSSYRDDDNADAACKAYRDGIADAMGIDDRDFRKSRLSTMSKDAACPRVEITIHLGHANAEVRHGASGADPTWQLSRRCLDRLVGRSRDAETPETHMETQEKALDVQSVEDAKAKVSDIQVVGNGDTFALLCKASSKSQGWMKSAKAMEVPGGCVVQVTTQQGSNIAEALTFVPGVKIAEDVNGGRKLVAL